MIKSVFLLTVFFFVFSIGSLFSQNPHLSGGDGSFPIGGGSPIGGGLVILTALGIGYSVSRIYRMRRNSKEAIEQ